MLLRVPPAMAIRAADLTAEHLFEQSTDPHAVGAQRRHVLGLLVHVVVLKDVRIAFAAVRASEEGRPTPCEPLVAVASSVEPARLTSGTAGDGPSAVTARAHELALSELLSQAFQTNAGADQRADIAGLSTDVVELEAVRVAKPTVAARTRCLDLLDERSRAGSTRV